MSPKIIRLIRWFAIIILAAVLALLVYSVLPNETMREIIPVTPTYLVPPAAIP